MSETQISDAGRGTAETETPPLKISSTDWPMTHFHERASNAPNDEVKGEAARMLVLSHWRGTPRDHLNFLDSVCDWLFSEQASTALSLIGL